MNKLLFLTNEINLSKGGQELANRYFLRMLKKKFSVFIVNQQFFRETENYKKVKINVNVDFRKGIIESFFYLSKLLKKLDSQDFKVVFISANPFSTLLFAFVIFLFGLFKKSKKIVFSHMDPYYSLFYSSRITYILLLLGKIFYKKFDLILTSNDQMKESFMKFYKVNKSKIEVLPLPLREEFYLLKKNKFSFKTLNINPEKPIFLSVGRLDQTVKDPFTIIKAFDLFLKKYKKGSLFFAGDGQAKKEMKKIIKKLGIEKKVYFLGFVKNPISLMKESDVFLFSSKTEGTPTVLIEAQATGLPIIATDCPVGPRWVLDNGKAGILVPVGDYKKMAHAMLKIVKDNHFKKRLAKKGLELSKRFDYHLIEKKIIKFT